MVFIGTGILLFKQFTVDPALYGGIGTSNYFALLLCAMVACVGLVKIPGEVCRGDVAAFVLFVYLLIHASVFHALQSREFYMCLSYFALYVVFRVINGMRLDDYVALAVMVCGIYQSFLVFGQLLGYEASNHFRFVVTGSFFNPGPCGIFLAGVFVLSVALLQKGYRKVGFSLPFVRYVVALVSLGMTLVAMVPTLSRAGWLGAAVGMILLYRQKIVRYIHERRYRVWMVLVVLVFLSLVYGLKTDSANGRLFIWRNVFSAYAEAPLFGVGINGFGHAYADAQHDYFKARNALEQEHEYTKRAGVVESAFNEPLALFLLLGTIGGGLGVCVLFFKLRRLTGYGCMVVSLLVSSIFSYPFYVPSIVILFLFALAQLPDRKIQPVYGLNWLVYGTMSGISLYFNWGEYAHREAYKTWKQESFLYQGEYYEGVIKEYEKLYPILQHDFKFLFEYGHSLHKVGEYEKSNVILKKGTLYSADPMFWNVIGNNFLAMEQYDQSEEAYLRAYYTCPNRLYPLYLLTKLEASKGDSLKMNYYARVLLNKRPKVPSSAVDEMKLEIRKLTE